jgi:hypothetical protein
MGELFFGGNVKEAFPGLVGQALVCLGDQAPEVQSLPYRTYRPASLCLTAREKRLNRGQSPRRPLTPLIARGDLSVK